MEINEFEKLVSGAVDSLPENIKGALKNVAIVIEEKESKRLLGLYEGIPENKWGKGESAHLPDKITIFKSSIEKEARTAAEIDNLVRTVVWHEIAHYLGFDEKKTRQLERRWRERVKN